jgi:hypothetical protein
MTWSTSEYSGGKWWLYRFCRRMHGPWRMTEQLKHMEVKQYGTQLKISELFLKLLYYKWKPLQRTMMIYRPNSSHSLSLVLSEVRPSQWDWLSLDSSTPFRV